MSSVASLYPTASLRSYVRMKIATDPAYEAVFDCLRGSEAPLLDVGCGIGVLAFYLRERGFRPPIVGIDHDRRKVDIARRVAGGEADLSFQVADARAPFDFRGDVVLLDVLHYFRDEEQAAILRNAAAARGITIVRDGLRDGTARYRLTYAAEALARVGGWLKAERLNFPTRDAIERPFAGAFRHEVRPMSKLPLNNYLFVFKRSADGITNA